MNIPFVSIGLPVFNGEEYIRESIDSLLSQTFKDFELIISDNASSDATEKICRDYEAKDKRIKYFRQTENIGSVKNFTFVREKGAQSKYFMWAAHDDYWDKNWLEVLLANIKPNDLGVRGKVVNINHSGKIQGPTSVTSFNEGQVLKVFMDNEKNCRGFYWYALFNTQLLSKVKMSLLDFSTFGSDVLFIAHMVQFGSLRTINETSQYYRRHDASTTNLFAKDWFGFRKLFYYIFPINTYIYTLSIIDKKYKPLIFFAIPFKYVKSQFNIWPRLLKLLITGKRL